MRGHIDAPFRIALGVMLIAAFVVRIYGHWQTLQAGRIRWIESKLNITLRIVAGLAGIATLWTYLIWPEGILWASVPVPDSIRWFGVAAGWIGVAMLAWVHRALGRNFAASLHIRTEGHRLVTSGPYRWVRNPMYTSIYILLISFFLVSASWLIGLAWFTGYTLLMISRVPKEEALMEQSLATNTALGLSVRVDFFREFLHTVDGVVAVLLHVEQLRVEGLPPLLRIPSKRKSRRRTS